MRLNSINFGTTQPPGKKPRMFCRLVLMGMCTFTLVSCIGFFKQWGDENSIVWRSPTFDPRALEDHPLVVLNALTGMGLEGYRHQVSQSLFLTLIKEKNPLSVLSPKGPLDD